MFGALSGRKTAHTFPESALIFGCDTSLRGEIAAHAWMAFGTTAPIADMHHAVANQNPKTVLAEIGYGTLMTTWLTMLPTLLDIFWKTRWMRKKIDYYRLDALLGRTIADIRVDHGIRV